MSAVGFVSSGGGAFAVQALPKKVLKSIPEMAFGKAAWEKYYGVDVGVEPTLPPSIEEILNSSCLFWGDKKVKETHLLTLIPEKIDGHPYTLNRLNELIRKPKIGHPTQYRHYENYVKNDVGEKKVSSSYWVLLTRELTPESGLKSYHGQDEEELVTTLDVGGKRESYTLPTALEATTSVLMEHARSGVKLLPKEPLTYTRCQDGVDHNRWAVMVGGFTSEGLDVNYAYGVPFGAAFFACEALKFYDHSNGDNPLDTCKSS